MDDNMGHSTKRISYILLNFQLQSNRSPSSDKVRGSDYVRWIALSLSFLNLFTDRKNIAWAKRYTPKTIFKWYFSFWFICRLQSIEEKKRYIYIYIYNHIFLIGLHFEDFVPFNQNRLFNISRSSKGVRSSDYYRWKALSESFRTHVVWASNSSSARRYKGAVLKTASVDWSAWNRRFVRRNTNPIHKTWV